MPPMYNRPEFVTMFLEKYKSLPSLWNKRCPGFSDRKQRERDYWDLFRMYKQNNQEATLRTMKSKMNSWFIVFRKEYSKARESILKGEQPPYLPSIWYYKNLLFLAENDSVVMNGQPRMPKHNPDMAQSAQAEPFEEVFLENTDEEPSKKSKTEYQWKEAKDHLRQVGLACPNVIQLQTIKSRPCLIIDGYRYRFKRSNKEGQAIWLCMKDRSHKCLGKVLTCNGEITPSTPHVCVKDEDDKKKKGEMKDEDWPSVPPPPAKRKPEDEPPSVVFDEYEIIGKTVASKLREMSEEQRMYCELIISQALTCGKGGRLTEDTQLTSVRPKDTADNMDTFAF